MSERDESRVPAEPSLSRALLRILRHALYIAFFAALHWGVKLLLKWTGQERELWAPLVTNGAAVMFVISFFVFGGTELVGDCWEAITGLIRRIRTH